MSSQKGKKTEKSPFCIKYEDKREYKFDINPKNLQCFLRKIPSKVQKKKINKIKSPSKLTSGPKNEPTNKQGEERIDTMGSKQKQNVVSKRNIQEIKQCSKAENTQHKRKQIGSSPDLLKCAMNGVISKIQNEGVKSKWEDEDNRRNEDTKSETDNLDLICESRRIWVNSETLPVIQETEKSFMSTEESILSGSSNSMTNRYYNNAGYFEYPLHYYTSPNSFIFQSSPNLYTEYDSISQEEVERYAKKIFEINPQQIVKDGRTTVMIKNIPNKYSLKLLSQELDEKYDNLYDFLYLPFDFNNGCNMGYAFINFITPEYLASFYNDFHHKKWLKFRSEKICVLTYARLQGRNSLIEHFSNSKVLNQKQKRYRPIIRDLSKISELLEKQRGKK